MTIADHDDLIERARDFAAARHAAQVKRRTGEPYFAHIERVVAVLEEHGHDAPVVIAAAYLHDTVEKSDTTFQELIDSFGSDVAELVFWLTDPPGDTPEDKLATCWRLSRAPLAAKLVKLADIIDNTATRAAADHASAKTFFAEKAVVLGMMVNVEGPQFAELPLYRSVLAAGADSTAVAAERLT